MTTIPTTGGDLVFEANTFTSAWCSTCKTSWLPVRKDNALFCNCGHLLATEQEVIDIEVEYWTPDWELVPVLSPEQDYQADREQAYFPA